MADTPAAVEKVRNRLAGNTDVRVVVGENSICVVPVKDGGFQVGLEAGARGFTVWFAGWHEEFRTEREALDCVGFGLSRRCRLKVLSAGGYDHRWTVEYRHEDRWLEESTTGHLLWPFWKKRVVRYLQNDVIAWEETP